MLFTNVMSIKIKFENSSQGILLICSDIVTGDELIEANNKILSESNVVYQICDFSTAKDIRIDIEQMHKIAIQDNSYPADSKLSHMAFVGDTLKWKTLSESYEQMSKDWVGRRTKFVTAMFENLEEARNWINRNI